MLMQLINSPTVTDETEKLNNEQYGACGSGAVWDSILRSALPTSLANDVCEDDNVIVLVQSNFVRDKVAVTDAAGEPELVAIETPPAMLYAVAVADGAPVVPVPTVPAEEAIKMIQTTDSTPVQVEAEEPASGEEPTSDAHASTRIAEIAAPVTCRPQAKTRHGVSSFALGMRTSNDTMSVECRGATPTWLHCVDSPRSAASPRCPLTRGFAATRCPLTVIGVFHWED